MTDIIVNNITNTVILKEKDKERERENGFTMHQQCDRVNVSIALVTNNRRLRNKHAVVIVNGAKSRKRPASLLSLNRARARGRIPDEHIADAVHDVLQQARARERSVNAVAEPQHRFGSARGRVVLVELLMVAHELQALQSGPAK